MVEAPEVDAISIAAAVASARRGTERGYARYRDDPVGFITEQLDEFIWSKQREIAEAVRDHRHVAVQSAHDTGKSFIAARLVAWWLSVHEPGEAFAVTSAPTFAQVRAILWREIGRAHRRGKLPGRTNQTEWHLGPEIVAMGRKPADYDEDAFQGIHARYVLVVLDEAGGISAALWTAAETITTNEGSRILAIGNPDSPLTHFAGVCKPESGWKTIHVDGLESPNFTDEPVPEELRSLLLSPTWVEERSQDWGEDSPLYESKVRGRFPLVPQGQVYQELGPHLEWVGPLPKFSRIVGGLDFGGARDDAHKTAGVVAGIVAPGQQIAGGNTLIRFAHFEGAGPKVHEQLVSWMRTIEAGMGRRVVWRADRTQTFGVSLADLMGFHIVESHGGADSVWLGIGLQRRRMKDGASFYTEELTKAPGPNGRSWYESMTRYRWKEQPDEERQVPGVPVKRDDDTPDADRYLHEEADGFPEYVGTVVGERTLAGRPRARSAV